MAVPQWRHARGHPVSGKKKNRVSEGAPIAGTYAATKPSKGDDLCTKKSETVHPQEQMTNQHSIDMMVMKYRFFVIPTKTFSFLSKPWQLNELQIRANTNTLCHPNRHS